MTHHHKLPIDAPEACCGFLPMLRVRDQQHFSNAGGEITIMPLVYYTCSKCGKTGEAAGTEGAALRLWLNIL